MVHDNAIEVHTLRTVATVAATYVHTVAGSHRTNCELQVVYGRAVLCCTTVFSAAPRHLVHAVPRHAALCCTALRCAVLCCAALRCAVLRCAALCCATQCCVMLCCGCDVLTIVASSTVLNSAKANFALTRTCTIGAFPPGRSGVTSPACVSASFSSVFSSISGMPGGVLPRCSSRDVFVAGLQIAFGTALPKVTACSDYGCSHAGTV
jgi:hypothetical protein